MSAYISIPTQSYDTILEQYSAALSWMKGLGVRVSPGRTSHYQRIIENWTLAYKTASAEDGKKTFPDFVSSMFEVFDFIGIHKAFSHVSVSQLKPFVQRLQKAVNGPFNAADETPASTAARNFLFEVALAAKVHHPASGIEVIFDANSDTGISLDGKKLWVECKRVTTVQKLEKNAREASSQLEKVLAKEVGSGHRGIVAMDISKILNQGDKIYVSRDDLELLASIDRIMNEFIREHAQVWERVYRRRNKKIIGTIIRFSFMATSEARNILVHASQWSINPRLGASFADEEIQRRLVATMR